MQFIYLKQYINFTWQFTHRPAEILCALSRRVIRPAPPRLFRQELIRSVRSAYHPPRRISNGIRERSRSKHPVLRTSLKDESPNRSLLAMQAFQAMARAVPIFLRQLIVGKLQVHPRIAFTISVACLDSAVIFSHACPEMSFA